MGAKGDWALASGTLLVGVLIRALWLGSLLALACKKTVVWLLGANVIARKSKAEEGAVGLVAAFFHSATGETVSYYLNAQLFHLFYLTTWI